MLSAPTSPIGPAVEAGASMDELLLALRAAAETTRLRLLVLCARGELTVSELVEILGQSQPRVSRHLKLLCDAGLLQRFKAGSWAFYRATDFGIRNVLAAIIARFAADSAQDGDLRRLAAVREERAAKAAA